MEENAVVFLDEIGLGGATGGGTLRLRGLEESVAQARKYLGEDGKIYYTTQLASFLTGNFRALSQFMIFPSLRLNTEKKGKLLVPDQPKNWPLTVQWIIFTKIPMLNEFVMAKKTDPIDVTHVPPLYDTANIVERIHDGRFERYLRKYGEYVQPDEEDKVKKRLVKELSLKLQKYEACSISESERQAYSIVHDL
jgi:hypothetical protein